MKQSRRGVVHRHHPAFVLSLYRNLSKKKNRLLYRKQADFIFSRNFDVDRQEGMRCLEPPGVVVPSAAGNQFSPAIIAVEDAAESTATSAVSGLVAGAAVSTSKQLLLYPVDTVKVGWAVCRSACPSICRYVGRRVGLPVYLSVGRHVGRSADMWVGRPVGRSVGQSVCLSVCLSGGLSGGLTVGRSVGR